MVDHAIAKYNQDTLKLLELFWRNREQLQAIEEFTEKELNVFLQSSLGSFLDQKHLTEIKLNLKVRLEEFMEEINWEDTTCDKNSGQTAHSIAVFEDTSFLGVFNPKNQTSEEKTSQCFKTRTRLSGTDVPGSRIKELQAQSAKDCQKRCAKEQDCNFFIFFSTEHYQMFKHKKCRLLREGGNVQPNQVGHISGPKMCSSSKVTNSLDKRVFLQDLTDLLEPKMDDFIEFRCANAVNFIDLFDSNQLLQSPLDLCPVDRSNFTRLVQERLEHHFRIQNLRNKTLNLAEEVKRETLVRQWVSTIQEVTYTAFKQECSTARNDNEVRNVPKINDNTNKKTDLKPLDLMQGSEYVPSHKGSVLPPERNLNVSKISKESTNSYEKILMASEVQSSGIDLKRKKEASKPEIHQKPSVISFQEVTDGERNHQNSSEEYPIQDSDYAMELKEKNGQTKKRLGTNVGLGNINFPTDPASSVGELFSSQEREIERASRITSEGQSRALNSGVINKKKLSSAKTFSRRPLVNDLEPELSMDILPLHKSAKTSETDLEQRITFANKKLLDTGVPDEVKKINKKSENQSYENDPGTNLTVVNIDREEQSSFRPFFPFWMQVFQNHGQPATTVVKPNINPTRFPYKPLIDSTFLSKLVKQKISLLGFLWQKHYHGQHFKN